MKKKKRKIVEEIKIKKREDGGGPIIRKRVNGSGYRYEERIIRIRVRVIWLRYCGGIIRIRIIIIITSIRVKAKSWCDFLHFFPCDFAFVGYWRGGLTW